MISRNIIPIITKRKLSHSLLSFCSQASMLNWRLAQEITVSEDRQKNSMPAIKRMV